MYNSKLFSFDENRKVVELPATSVTIEEELQILIERNMKTFFGVKYLKSKHYISYDLEIDSLGLDENYCPVIFEYKKYKNQSILSQGLAYLDWLLKNKSNFEMLVLNKLGKENLEKIDWTMPRLIFIAGDYIKYDTYAINQIERNISLFKYIKYESNHILMQLIKEVTNKRLSATSSDNTFEKQLEKAPQNIKDMYNTIRNYIVNLGDDITANQLKFYVSFKKIKNIVCVEVYQSKILIHLSLNPKEISLEDGFTRDVINIGHFGTGNLRVTIKSIEDFKRAKCLIDKAYETN